jgi:hypothetical protein
VSEQQPAAAGQVTAEQVTVGPAAAEQVTGEQVTAEQAQVFADEVGDAVRYERGLAVKCLFCVLLVAVILALRVYFFG